MNKWHEILSLALYTPSPHNVQPWKVRITDENTADLFIDRSRMLPKEDLTGSFVLSAMSMMVESIAILAANRKLRLESDIIYNG